jgi:hypothetical protein
MSDSEKRVGPWDDSRRTDPPVVAAPKSRRGDRAALGLAAAGWLDAIARWLRRPRPKP